MKNILVTGCTGGLGSALKKELMNKNFKVFSHSCNNTADIQIDFTKEKDIEKIKDFIFENNICYLINNSALYSDKELQDISEQEINNIIKINLIAPIILCKYMYEFILQNNKQGFIININSLAGKYANFKESVYCASKFGLTGFSSSLSMNQKKSNIKIIDCHIGAMKTNMTNDRQNKDSIMEPEDVAKFIVERINFEDKYILSSFELRNSK